MSEHEMLESENSDSSEEFTAKNALPWPETSVELASKLQAMEFEDRPPTPSPPLINEKYALPWQSNHGNKITPKEINILLLGESGVGKSTFINSFANYMKHENFEAVQQNNLRVLIPARFHIFDKFLKRPFYRTVVVFGLIDTPGMGDPRGIDQDNKNCDYVLNYLGRLEKVHAICLLLKPTNTRLDVFLNYCITQILSRLDRSATENIAFLFTNTRGQNYTPGDTYTSLELLVKKIKDTNNVFLPLSIDNVFCFDNEAFRFLASIKHGVEFKEGILEANIESWKYSYKEVYRLLSYIVKLKPHDPKKTISINHARKMVLQLAQPLAEIVQLIGDNIYELDQHTNQLLMENQTLDQLKQKLHMPVIDIRVKELPQPVTVCTAPKCSAIYKVADKNKFHYKQRCHNPCYLNNVPAEIVGDPHILGCWAINNSTQTCHQCNCRFNTHMHIYYETDTFENKIVDTNILKNINTKEDATREKESMINKILNRKEELEKEHKYIIKCTATFAHFLQQNAITPINDSLKEYIKYLITREENLGPNSSRVNLDYLRRLLAEYEQEKNVLEEAMKYDSATNGAFDNSPNAIETKIRELFTLRHFGKKIKQLYDLHQSGGITEHKQSEYVVKELYQLSIVDKFKSFGGSLMNAIGFGNKTKKQNKVRYEMEMERRYRNSNMYRNMPTEYPRYQDSHYFFGPRSSDYSSNSHQSHWSKTDYDRYYKDYHYNNHYEDYCYYDNNGRRHYKPISQHSREFGTPITNFEEYDNVTTFENEQSLRGPRHSNDKFLINDANDKNINSDDNNGDDKSNNKKRGQKAIENKQNPCEKFENDQGHQNSLKGTGRQNNIEENNFGKQTKNLSKRKNKGQKAIQYIDESDNSDVKDNGKMNNPVNGKVSPTTSKIRYRSVLGGPPSTQFH